MQRSLIRLFGSTTALVLAIVVAGAVTAAPPDRAARKLRVGPPIFSVGELDGPEEEVFGWIGDLALGLDGGVVVADVQAPAIFRFDGSGALSGVAREGSGPGEVRTPRSVDVDETGRLLVLDRGNMRVARYSGRGPGLSFESGFPLRLPRPHSLCSLGETIHVLSQDPEGLIHVLDSEGGRVRRIALPEEPASDDERASTTASWSVANTGLLACESGRGTVVLVHTRIGVVRAFDRDGEPLWRKRDPDWPLHDEDGGRSPLREVSHVAADGDWLFLTVWLEGVDGAEDRIEVRVLRLSDGEEVDRQAMRGRLADARDGLAVFHVREPFPRIEVREYAVE